jgi:hypothetical protein
MKTFDSGKMENAKKMKRKKVGHFPLNQPAEFERSDLHFQQHATLERHHKSKGKPEKKSKGRYEWPEELTHVSLPDEETAVKSKPKHTSANEEEQEEVVGPFRSKKPNAQRFVKRRAEKKHEQQLQLQERKQQRELKKKELNDETRSEDEHRMDGNRNHGEENTRNAKDGKREKPSGKRKRELEPHASFEDEKQHQSTTSLSHGDESNRRPQQQMEETEQQRQARLLWEGNQPTRQQHTNYQKRKEPFRKKDPVTRSFEQKQKRNSFKSLM